MHVKKLTESQINIQCVHSIKRLLNAVAKMVAILSQLRRRWWWYCFQVHELFNKTLRTEQSGELTEHVELTLWLHYRLGRKSEVCVQALAVVNMTIMYQLRYYPDQVRVAGIHFRRQFVNHWYKTQWANWWQVEPFPRFFYLYLIWCWSIANSNWLSPGFKLKFYFHPVVVNKRNIGKDV